MKIGIDAQSTSGEKTGIGYYTKNLLRQFAQAKGIDICQYKNNSSKDLATLKRVKWENIDIPHFAKKDKIDILHIPGFAGPLFKSRYKKITTVHDLIGMIYPENLAPASRLYWQRWLPACIKTSDFIIADSENTKNDIIRLLNVSSAKIKVIYLASDESFRPVTRLQEHKAVLSKYGISKKYILNVGTIEPRKNISSLIVAFGQYVKETKRSDLQLVLAGKKGWDYTNCFNKAKESGAADNIIFNDYVSDNDLIILYNYAEAFAYPSFYEGFGLPVLEAMSCGTPVICSKLSSLPEITADAALAINPGDINSIKNALSVMMGNESLKNEFSRKAVEQAKRFSWEKTAEQTLNVYREISGKA